MVRLNSSSFIVPVGSLSPVRGKVRVVSSSSIVVDRIGFKVHERGVLITSSEIEECMFEACDIEVCGKRAEVEGQFLVYVVSMMRLMLIGVILMIQLVKYWILIA